MGNYIKNCIEMLGRFVIFSIVLYMLPKMDIDKFPEILACIIILAWLFIPVIELVTIELKGGKKNGRRI